MITAPEDWKQLTLQGNGALRQVQFFHNEENP
jgi:hypothetical protein